MMTRLPYPRKPEPEYTTRPSAAATTESPALPPISMPLVRASSKTATTAPSAGQIQPRSSSPDAEELLPAPGAGSAVAAAAAVFAAAAAAASTGTAVGATEGGAAAASGT